MKRNLCRCLFFFMCLVCFIGLSSVRSQPVFGKLDFLLLDGRPWWKPWRPMIEHVVKQGKRPILTDISTSTVLRSVFAQKAALFRFSRGFTQLDVENISNMNDTRVPSVPVGALLVLLDSSQPCYLDYAGVPADGHSKPDRFLIRLLADAAHTMAEARATRENRYRCVINLHGFIPSWVPVETGHWSTQWADTSWFYSLHGLRGKKMKALLQINPPENCTVFY